MFDAPPPKYNPQILIVEDDPSIRDLMRLVVQTENHWQPTTVETGAEAIEAWENGDFDVVLMDLKLPVMGGVEATRVIRDNERRSGQKHTPIIAFTALLGDEDRKECVEAGFDDFIAKPSSIQEIINTVYKFIQASQFL